MAKQKSPTAKKLLIRAKVRILMKELVDDIADVAELVVDNKKFRKALDRYIEKLFEVQKAVDNMNKIIESDPEVKRVVNQAIGRIEKTLLIL